MNIGDELKRLGFGLVEEVLEEGKEVFCEMIGTENKEKKDKKRKNRNRRGDRRKIDKYDYSPPKRMIKNEGISFGYKTNGIVKRKLKFPKNDWIHKIIIGSSGSGKTTWAEKYVINSDDGVCFIDNTSGEAVNRILRALPDERLEKTVVLDHSDKNHPLPIGLVKGGDNIFQNDMITEQWVDFFITNFGVKDLFRTQELIRYTCKAVFSVDNATVLDTVQFVLDGGFRNRVLCKLDKDEFKDTIDYWNRFNQMDESKQRRHSEAFLHRVGILLSNTFLKVTLGQRPNRNIKYRKWMDEGYIVLIKCPETHISEQSMRIIVSLHVLSFWRSALSRRGMKNPHERQFTIIADEPQSWLSNNVNVLDDIFSKARKYGLNIFCLFQSTEQIRKKSRALLTVIEDNEPDIIALSKTNLLRMEKRRKRIDWENLEKYNFYAKLRNTKIFKGRCLGTLDYVRDMKEVNKFIERQKNKYNRYYKKVLKNINRRLDKEWGGEVNIKDPKSGLQKGGLKKSVNQESRKEIGKSLNSSMRIDW